MPDSILLIIHFQYLYAPLDYLSGPFTFSTTEKSNGSDIQFHKDNISTYLQKKKRSNQYIFSSRSNSHRLVGTNLHDVLT